MVNLMVEDVVLISAIQQSFSSFISEAVQARMKVFFLMWATQLSPFYKYYIFSSSQNILVILIK